MKPPWRSDNQVYYFGSTIVVVAVVGLISLAIQILIAIGPMSVAITGAVLGLLMLYGFRWWDFKYSHAHQTVHKAS